MNTFLQELCNWLDDDRLGKKVLFVRNRTTGNQLLRMAANHGVPAVNCITVPVRAYMNQLAEGKLVARGLQRIDSITAAVALQRIMEEVGGNAFTTMGQVEMTTAALMLPQLEELEENGIDSAQLSAVGQPLLGQVWEAYLAWKKENGYVLEADLPGIISVPSSVRYAILSDVPVTGIEQDFLETIPAGRLTLISVGVPVGMKPVRNAVFSADAAGADASSVAASLASTYARIHCIDCQDIGTEIRAAFQHLLENRIPAENAVFVCPDEQYARRAVSEGKLLGIHVDSAFGKPASMTSGALLIRCLLEFAASDYDAETLTPALISGTMGAYDENKKLQVYGQMMLRIFRDKGVGWGKERWERLCADPEDRPSLAGQSVFAWVSFFEAPARPVRDVAGELLDLIRGSLRLGEEYEMYLRIVDEISRIYPGQMKGAEYLSLVEEIASSLRVSPHPTDLPGHVYCCGYESILSVDRPVFVFLGMSWDAFNRLTPEFPLLHDDEKAALSPRLALAGDRAYGRQYAVREFLQNRLDATVIFSRARTDYIGGEGVMAAGIFDDAAAAHLEYRVRNEKTGKDEICVPQVNILGHRALTESDVRMRCGYEPRVLDFEMDEGRAVGWKEDFDSRVWSATMLETAASCPRRFVFKTQMGISEERPSALERYGSSWLDSLSRGNLVHEVLEGYFREVMPRRDAVDEALLERLIREKKEKYLLSVPVPVNIRDIEPEVAKIRKITRQVIAQHAADASRETVGVEIDFGGNRDLSLTFGEFTVLLNGRIDRVDRVADGVEIIDYKTGKPYNFRKKSDEKLQYYLYTLAWEKLHPDMPVVRATYALLDALGELRPIVIEMTPEVREKMYGKVTELLRMLSSPSSAITRVTELQGEDGEFRECDDYCPYSDFCWGPIGRMLGDEPAEDETDEDEDV